MPHAKQTIPEVTVTNGIHQEPESKPRRRPPLQRGLSRNKSDSNILPVKQMFRENYRWSNRRGHLFPQLYNCFWNESEMQIALPQAPPPAPYLPHKGVINLEQKPFLCSRDKSQWNPNVNPDIFYVVKIIFCRLNIWYFHCALLLALSPTSSLLIGWQPSLWAHKTFACSEQSAENRVQTARLRLIREHSLSRTLSTSVLLKKNKISFWEKYRAQ